MKGNNIIIHKLREKEVVETFWKDIWQNEASFNGKTKCLQQLEKHILKHNNNNYKIDRKILDKVIKKIQISKAPDNDLINRYWYKHLTSYQNELSVLFNQQIHESPLLTWLKATHTVLLSKNTDTHVAKNYCPITCLNVMYKLYSSCISQCLMEHVYKSNFVTPEQAAG